MTSKAESLLNPCRHYLSEEAKKRLRWLYALYYENDNNVTKAAHKTGLSREWLSKLKNKFEKHHKDPRSLEPASKAPHNTRRRTKISRALEQKIIEARDQYGWGKEKIAQILKRDYQLKVSPSTVNRYLRKHLKIAPKLSARNKKAWQEKQSRDQLAEAAPLKIKWRPPRQLKDFRPGALIEKDMKLIPTSSKISQKSSLDGKYHVKDHVNYQHTFIDSFTRLRVMALSSEPDSQAARMAYQLAKNKFPFPVASLNTDSGGENGKDFQLALQTDQVLQFHSRTGTPTDNPRVERSHLTDEQEFYQRQRYYYRTLEEQRQGLEDWERVYNFTRPHQALGYLTPMEFYKLWQVNPQAAQRLTVKWQRYLNKQRKRLSSARRLKRREQIQKLMEFIEAKLNGQKGVEDKLFNLSQV